MRKLEFLKPIINFHLIGVLITTLSRFILFLAFLPRITDTESYGLLFPIGLRIDIILLSYMAALSTVLILLQAGKEAVQFNVGEKDTLDLKPTLINNL